GIATALAFAGVLAFAAVVAAAAAALPLTAILPLAVVLALVAGVVQLAPARQGRAFRGCRGLAGIRTRGHACHQTGHRCACDQCFRRSLHYLSSVGCLVGFGLPSPSRQAGTKMVSDWLKSGLENARP